MAYGYYPQFYQPQQRVEPQSGFVGVRSEEEARAYPVAPGNSVTFKVEGQAIIIEKTMGFSQFDTPKIEKYRLVKETPEEPPKVEESPQYKDLWDEIAGIKTEIELLKKGVGKNDAEYKSNHECC